MKITSMGLAWISVSKAATAKSFFSETLGMEVASAAEEYGWFEFVAADKTFRLGVGTDCTGNGPVKPGMNAVVTLTVDDVVAAKAELEAKGVTFVGDIQEVPGHVKMALFQDTDGNHFQLVQMLGSCD